MSESHTLEEARILIANAELCAAVTQMFTEAKIAAFGDYRDESEEVLIRDAFADNVEYVVFANIWHLLERPNRTRTADGDLHVKVYLRREREVKTMKVRAAIKMILERRQM